MSTQDRPPIDLPAPVAAFFAPDGDAEVAARCFSEDAVVLDERRTHHGRAAIARWRREAAAQYSFTSEPLAIQTSGDEVTVRSRVRGDFPGSPIELRYRFTLAGDEIARLEIAP